MSGRWVLLLALMVGGCAVSSASDPHAHTPASAAEPLGPYARGFAEGKRAAHLALQNRSAFRVTAYELGHCDTRASWLPRNGVISDSTWWRSRARNLVTLDRCANRNDAKRTVIIQMLDAVRDP